MTVQIDRGSYALQMAIFSGVPECPQFSCNKRKKLAHHGRAYINMNAVQRMSGIVNFDTL